MHFVLVHGAYHGAWCWDELRAELERGGHASTAVNLPCDDPDAGAESYVDEILHAIPKQAGSVVMVGHSLAGLSIPIAASRTRTARTWRQGLPLRNLPSVIQTAAPPGPKRERSRSFSTTANRKSLSPRRGSCDGSTGKSRKR